MSFLKSLLTFRNSKSMRVQDDIELKSPTGIKQDGIIKHTHKVSKKDRDEFTPGCLKGEVLSRVFAEDYQLIETSILDPRGPVVRHWNELLNVVIFRDGAYLTLKEVFESMDLTGLSEKKRRGRSSISRKSVSLDHIMVPETVFALSEKTNLFIPSAS